MRERTSVGGACAKLYVRDGVAYSYGPHCPLACIRGSVLYIRNGDGTQTTQDHARALHQHAANNGFYNARISAVYRDGELKGVVRWTPALPAVFPLSSGFLQDVLQDDRGGLQTRAFYTNNALEACEELKAMPSVPFADVAALLRLLTQRRMKALGRRAAAAHHILCKFDDLCRAITVTKVMRAL